MTKRDISMQQFWTELKSTRPPGMGWLFSAVACIATGSVADIAVRHFSNDAVLGAIVLRVGVLASVFGVWRAVRSAWHFRGAFWLFLYLALSIWFFWVLSGCIRGLAAVRRWIF